MAAMSPAAVQAGDCAMGKTNAPADHGKMPCCIGDCTTMGTAGVMQPDNIAVTGPQPVRAPLAMPPVKQLNSLAWATVDPPPRV